MVFQIALTLPNAINVNKACLRLKTTKSQLKIICFLQLFQLKMLLFRHTHR